MDIGDDREIVINLGGEGELPSSRSRYVIDVNLPWILEPGFKAARDGKTTLDGIRRGNAIVLARGDHLPFRTGAVDTVRAENVPIGDYKTWLGPAYSPAEMRRIIKARSRYQVAAVAA